MPGENFCRNTPWSGCASFRLTHRDTGPLTGNPGGSRVLVFTALSLALIWVLML